MSKNTLSKEIQKELDRLNDRIDRKIIKGQSFEKESRRHRELLATLERINTEGLSVTKAVRKRMRHVQSPVRRRLAGGAVQRLFSLSAA